MAGSGILDLRFGIWNWGFFENAGISHGFEIIFGVKMGGFVFKNFVFDIISWDFGVLMDTWYGGTLFG